MNRTLQEKIDAAPRLPGCYLFYDQLGNIIYVGKSKMLAGRVRSYFHASAKEDDRVWKLVREIRDVSFITTPTEVDALLQEYRLIKEHKPWFNSQHIRDLQRPYIRIDFSTGYPTISIATEKLDDEAEYYGAFDDLFDAREAIELLNIVWKTPLCGKAVFDPNVRPCLYHGMGKCSAPCAGIVDVSKYHAAVADAAHLLSGQQAMAVDALSDEMSRLASRMCFEQAGAIKDLLARMERLRRKCRRRFRISGDTNALVFLRAQGGHAFSVFFVSMGAILCRADFQDTLDMRAEEAFITAASRKQPLLQDMSWLSGALMEVFAIKEYVELPAKITRQAIRIAFADGIRTIGQSSP